MLMVCFLFDHVPRADPLLAIDFVVTVRRPRQEAIAMPVGSQQPPVALASF